MEESKSFDQELLRLFSNMINDDDEKLIFQIIFTNNDEESLIDELVKVLERDDHDKN